MKINRQFTLVLLGSVLFFAVVSTMASYQTLSIMQEHAAYSFLTTTSGFAESMMQEQSGDRVRGGGPRRLAARAGRRGRCRALGRVRGVPR